MGAHYLDIGGMSQPTEGQGSVPLGRALQQGAFIMIASWEEASFILQQKKTTLVFSTGRCLEESVQVPERRVFFIKSRGRNIVIKKSYCADISLAFPRVSHIGRDVNYRYILTLLQTKIIGRSRSLVGTRT